MKRLKLFPNLQIRTHLFANSVSNYHPVTAYLPKERERIISEIQNILDTTSEQDMQTYRANLKSLGQDSTESGPTHKAEVNAVDRAYRVRGKFL